MWIAHNCWISVCYFLDIVNLVIFHPEYIDSGRLFNYPGQVWEMSY